MPNVFTPFLRRFTDERARDTEETRALFERVRARYLASGYSKEDALFDLTCTLASFIPHMTADACVVIENILENEVIFGFPTPNLDYLTLKEAADLRRYLRAKEYFFDHEEKVWELIVACMRNIFTPILPQLPKTEDPSPFTIPIIYALSNPKETIDNIHNELWKQEYVDNGLFVELSNRLYYNLCETSGQDPEKPKKLLRAVKNPAPLSTIVDEYCGRASFDIFFKTPIPLKVTHHERFSHMHIVGGSGAGKTQLLQNLILHDLRTDRPALVIVDSQGDLISNLLRLDGYEPLLITPKDVHHPPAVNIFDVKRLETYDQAKKEQVTAGVIQTFDYLFTGLLGADLTAKQSVFFRYVARLMLLLPETMGRNATVLDMMALMDDDTPYRDAIENLPDIHRQFFERDFKNKTFNQTREQVRYRLQAILENPTLARLFTSSETKIDLFKELNNRSVILIDTAKDFLKGASAHFGRIFISLVLQAVLERAVIPEDKREPAFLIVDEAAQYFDQNISDLLTEARKYKLGCVFAHQFLDQCTSALKSSLAANTAIKMAGNVSVADARALAGEMRTTPDFILSQPKLHFACHIRNVTPQAVSIPIQVGKLEGEPTRSKESYDRLIASNRERVSAPRLPKPKSSRKPPEPEEPELGTESSPEW